MQRILQIMLAIDHDGLIHFTWVLWYLSTPESIGGDSELDFFNSLSLDDPPLLVEIWKFM